MDLAELHLELRTRIEALETTTHRKLDALVAAVHHLMTRDPTMDHAALLALAKTVDSDVDTAVAAFQTLQASHDTVTDALDDVGTVLSGIPAKLAKITGAAIIGQAASTDSAAPITAVVTAPTTSGSTVIPVAQAAVGDIATAVSTATAAGSTVAVSGPGVASGTTVTAADPVTSTITLDTATNASHAGDGSEQLTVTPPASPS